MLKKITAIAICLILLYSVVSATDVNNLQNQRNGIQSNIDEATDELNSIHIELTENLKKLNDLQSKIDSYQNDLDKLNVDLNKLYQDLDIVQTRLDNVQKNYDSQMKIFQTRIVTLYESGDTTYLDVLLDSNSLSDFVSNYYLISEVASYDRELLDNIKQEKDNITNIKQILNDKKESAKTLKDSKEKTIISIENAKVIRDDYVKKLNEQELATQAKIDAYRQSLDSVNQELILAANSVVGADYVGGVFAWPAPGYYTITSRFGMRFHPILQIWRMHTGTDIGCPTGSNIVAANDGVVIKSEYNGGYGNMIMIDHGGGISTVYGHGSELIAKAGDVVKKGDVIMKSGSTGLSTGPHLHFEVRINGIFVDSLPYITNLENTKNITEDVGGGQS